jgi:tripartite-type tricarboxylate transporter receptor subunit TctC
MVQVFFAILLLVMGSSAVRAAAADEYPSRAVRIIVPFTPGGPTDTYARLIAEKLQSRFGQAFYIENKPGATGGIGTAAVAAAPADGYTLLFASNSSHLIGQLLQAKKSFNPADFRPLGMLLRYPLYLVVGTSLPVRSVAEFVAYAKDNPGKLNFGSPGTGSGGHLVTELFNTAAGIKAVHIPYKGVAPAQVGLMSGEIQFMFDSVGSSQGLVEDGKLRGLAVSGGERLLRVGDIPTLKEAGYPQFDDMVIWLGMLGPAAMPDPIAQKLEKALAEIIRLPDITKRIQELSAVPVGGSGDELAAFMMRETPLWEAVIRESNIPLQ